jgi:hypothetical protein
MGGFKTRFLLYTVPGQVYYNATRKLVLRGVDALIFVADSERGKMDENLDSLQNLRDNLKEYGLRLEEIPWVIQYNKRDLPDVYTVEELEKALNPDGVPCFEAVAMTGDGVFETFRGVSKLVLQKLSREVKLGEGRVTQKLAQSTAKAEAPAAGAEDSPSESPTVKIPTPVARKPVAPAARPGAPPPEETPLAQTLPPVPAVETEAPAAAAASQEDAPSATAPAEPARPRWTVPASYSQRWEDPRPGFWARLFGGRGRGTLPAAPPEPRVASVALSPVGGAGAVEPVVIEKRVSVPITLGPEEVLRGARLRLVLEIQVDAASSEKTSRVA